VEAPEEAEIEIQVTSNGALPPGIVVEATINQRSEVKKALDKPAARLPPERIQHFAGALDVLPELIKDPLGFVIRGRRWPLGRSLPGV